MNEANGSKIQVTSTPYVVMQSMLLYQTVDLSKSNKSYGKPSKHLQVFVPGYLFILCQINIL